ncbi:Pyridine nucleotide-disulfide oxidoreductase,dimerization domain protein [Staphylococcus aureus]|nr:Pyridine nucleotide-disulfide oxidoreductase,dimerization domain protein [Staphylococcus aureus]CAA4186769.1 Pyridine nucleotide-disulfide oxidoreductase,dimerization domain protein [Staphylococcus aureus]CAA4284359.1 Pyridine nucleotide-disulfide oxidoreductase,dimerization domain protein [Staphylococcus aureus]CAA4286825.1 Pyridine nucleotide-disulfide oxidoreductase,dimerization domain protein [Staphylococcus aureus]CAA4287662.1 Pyridine nucleotide-disulfide oxidoreductase,dimerization do
MYARKKEDITRFEADIVIHGAGRGPALDMNLEKGNIERKKHGVHVNEYLQSVSNPNVYAAGDAAATDGLPLTPVASADSHVVASNLLKGNSKKIEYPVIPSAVFTVPKMASVGMSEEEAKNSGRNIKVKQKNISDWFTYKRTNEDFAAFKVLISTKELKQMIFAYPTAASDIAHML